MLRIRSRCRVECRRMSALVAGAAAIFASTPAQAHFSLDAPTAWMSQNSSGGPQKQGPCGDPPAVSAGEVAGTKTGVVTQFQAGETITMKWTELVSHDGWYRISLSYDNRADFTDPPVVVTRGGSSADAGIESTPIAPVLVDGLFPHTMAQAPPGTKYTYSLKLPTTPCVKCTLQVIQFMNGHPSNLPNFADGGVDPDGFFYHHCADISIVAGEGGAGASGASGEIDAAMSGEGDATLSGQSGTAGGAGATTGASGDTSGSTATAGASGANAATGASGDGTGTNAATGASGDTTATGATGAGASGAGNRAAGSSGSTTNGGAPSDNGQGGGCLISARGNTSSTRSIGRVFSLAALGVLAVAVRRRRRRAGFRRAPHAS
jgi:hypothetical protein